MKGSIHSDQVCPICKSRFKPGDGKRPLYCPNHPEQAPNRFVLRYGRNITKRFASYEAALQVLSGLRFQEGSGKFDPRDYQVKAKPLAFDRLATEWLEVKKTTLRPKAHQPIRNALEKAGRAWGDANIKSITYAHIEDFINGLQAAPKTKKNTLDALKQFWKWAEVRYSIKPLKTWPNLGAVEMKMRKTISTAEQEAVLAKVKELAGPNQLKIWLAVKWLMTYNNVRPGELVYLIEGNMDYETGVLLLPTNTKERKPKFIELLDDDIELLNLFPKEHPSMPFFRHDAGRYTGRQFGPQLLWKYAIQAAAELGIQGVDLYGMTKHSTVTNMLEVATPDEILETTGHQTSKAFRRYLQVAGKRVKEIRSRRKVLIERADKHLINGNQNPQEHKTEYLQ
jgi:hypothetical protein